MIRGTPRRLLIAALLSATAAVHAQGQPPGNGGWAPPNQNDMNGSRPPMRRQGPPMDELASVLGLQPQQRNALEALLRQRHEAMDRQREDMRRQDDALSEQFDLQIAKVLTPQQMARFRQWELTHRPPPPRPGDGGPDGRGMQGGPQQGRGGMQNGGEYGPPQGRPPGGMGDHGDRPPPPPPPEDGVPPSGGGQP